MDRARIRKWIRLLRLSADPARETLQKVARDVVPKEQVDAAIKAMESSHKNQIDPKWLTQTKSR